MARTSPILTQDHPSSSPAFKVTIQRIWRMRGCHVVRRCRCHVGKNILPWWWSSLGGARLEDGKFFWANTPLKTNILISKKAIFERRYLLQTIILGINVKFLHCKLQHVAAFLFNLLLLRFLIAPGRGRFAVSDSCLRPLVFGAFRFVWWSWAFVVTKFPTYQLFQHLFMVFEMIRNDFKWMMKWNNFMQQKKHIEMLVNHPTNFLLFWFRVCCVNLTGQILCHVGSFIPCTNDPVVSGRAPHLRCRPRSAGCHQHFTKFLMNVFRITSLEEKKHEYHHSILKTPKKISGFFFFA